MEITKLCLWNSSCMLKHQKQHDKFQLLPVLLQLFLNESGYEVIFFVDNILADTFHLKLQFKDYLLHSALDCIQQKKLVLVCIQYFHIIWLRVVFPLYLICTPPFVFSKASNKLIYFKLILYTYSSTQSVKYI